MADTIQVSLIEQGRPWRCLDIKKLIVFIAVDGRSADDIGEEGSCSQSRAVFGRFSRLAQLECLLVGAQSVSGHNGLYFRLASGMEQLETLKKPAWLGFTHTKHDMDAEDVT